MSFGEMPLPPAVNKFTSIDHRLIVVASLLLSFWLIIIDPVVNRDAITYLRSAEAFLQDGFLASQNVYGRPLLPICIALVHKLTGISLLYSGLLITSFFYALLSVAFVATVRTLGGNRQVQIIAAIIIISHPLLNDSRTSINRDPAFWAMATLSFRELLRYVDTPSLKYQLRWFFYILLAILFRYEGIFFAVLAPFSLLTLRNFDHKFRRCSQFFLPPLIAFFSLAWMITLLEKAKAPNSRLFPGIERRLEQLLEFPELFEGLTSDYGNLLLNFTAKDDASVALLSGLAGILAINIIRATTWPYMAALVLGWKLPGTTHFHANHRILLRAHLLITLFYLSAFTLATQFMIERYCKQFVIFVLLYLPFILNALWEAAQPRWKRIFVACLLLGMSLDSLHNREYEKVFMRDAKEWIFENTPTQSSLISNSKYIAHFSKRDFNWNFAQSQHFDIREMLASRRYWMEYDYMAMLVKPRDLEYWESFLNENSLNEIKSFEGGGKGRVSIVKLHNNLLIEDADQL